MKKLRTRRHAVVLNRSRGGDVGITIVLALMGAVMVLPLIYMVMQSLKPLDEFFVFPPRFYVVHPTLNNFRDLFFLMSTSWVPLSRYLFNTVFTSVAGTFGQLILASLAAYVLATELICAGQALDCHMNVSCAPATAAVYELLRKEVPTMDDDAALSPYMEAVAQQITDRAYLRAVEQVTGRLAF